MFLTIITCCFNSENRLLKCLHKIDQAIILSNATKVEVIIVNNASTDKTEHIAKTAITTLSGAIYRYIEEHKSGLMFARITGIRAAEGDIICFLDDDNLVTPEYFNILIKVFEREAKVGFFGCSTALPNDRKFPSEIEPFHLSFAVGDRYNKSGCLEIGADVWGAGLAARSNLLQRIVNSEFEPILIGRSGRHQLAGDDSELCLAMNIAGWNGWYHCEPLIEHAIDISRMTIENLESMYKGFGASSSIIRRYFLFSNGYIRISLLLFPYIYPFKVTLNFISSLLKFTFSNKTNYIRLEYIAKSAALKFYFSKENKIRTQTKNMMRLSEINCKNLPVSG